MLTIGPLNDLNHVRHAFFTRQGGVSEGLYASLNCGVGSDDRPEHVAENRARAMAHLDLSPDRLATVYQVHSDRVETVDEPWAYESRPQADAMVTNQPGLALGILTADCVPVLLADAETRVIGAAHAGWRGALSGVLGNTLAAMERLGAKRDKVISGIGPCIAQRSYEVGPEFPEPFIEQSDDNRDFFCPALRDGHFLFDLKGYVARQLCKQGVGGVACLPCDTCAESERFFSYRRATLNKEADYGRGLSAIYLEP